MTEDYTHKKSYESDPNAITETIPEPLEPDGSNSVLYEYNLKFIPDVDGSLQIAQLVAYNEDIHIKWAWEGPARLALFPHVNAPVADLPVYKVNKGMDLIGDMTFFKAVCSMIT